VVGGAWPFDTGPWPLPQPLPVVVGVVVLRDTEVVVVADGRSEVGVGVLVTGTSTVGVRGSAERCILAGGPGGVMTGRLITRESIDPGSVVVELVVDDPGVLSSLET
jgi:hypothetical protein